MNKLTSVAGRASRVKTVADAPSRRRTQAERVAESDRRMLDAATALIARAGYSGATLESIGSEAGYSRQLVAQRFGSKDKLLETVISGHGDTLRERASQRRLNLSGLQALFTEVDSYLQALDAPSVQSRAFFVLMLESAGPAPQFRPVFAAITARWQDSLSDTIAEAQAQGAIRKDIDPRMEALLLIATLRGVRIQSLMDPSRSNVPEAINAIKLGLAERLLPGRTRG
jgi:AcrR family transcriptional regulator